MIIIRVATDDTVYTEMVPTVGFFVNWLPYKKPKKQCLFLIFLNCRIKFVINLIINSCIVLHSIVLDTLLYNNNNRSYKLFFLNRLITKENIGKYKNGNEG